MTQWVPARTATPERSMMVATSCGCAPFISKETIAPFSRAVPMIRSEDVFARYGGEEFVIMSRSTDPPSAAVVSERVRQHVEKFGFEYESKRIPVTVSLGVAGMPHGEIKAPEDLLARADRALYEAKRAGRNRMVQAAM